MFSGTGPAWSEARDKETGLRLRGAAEKAVANILAAEPSTGMTTAALALELDDFRSIERQNGTKGTKAILLQTGERLSYALRDSDMVVRLNGARFAIAMGPTRRVDLGTLIQLSARIQGRHCRTVFNRRFARFYHGVSRFLPAHARAIKNWC